MLKRRNYNEQHACAMQIYATRNFRRNTYASVYQKLRQNSGCYRINENRGVTCEEKMSGVMYEKKFQRAEIGDGNHWSPVIDMNRRGNETGILRPETKQNKYTLRHPQRAEAHCSDIYRPTPQKAF